MAPGVTTLSGAYVVSDKVGIEAFIESIITSTMSGAQVFIIPSGGNTCFVGVTEQKN